MTLGVSSTNLSFSLASTVRPAATGIPYIMSHAFREHPLRHILTAELHARTYQPLRAPERVSYLAVMCGEQGTDSHVQHLKRLLAHYSRPIPETVDQSYSVGLGPIRLRWERHTEFVTYTFSKQGTFVHPFAYPVLHELPRDWLAEAAGRGRHRRVAGDRIP